MYIGEWAQNLIHKLEIGAGRRVVRITVMTLVVVALTVVGWVLAAFAMRQYRARVPYWV